MYLRRLLCVLKTGLALCITGGALFFAWGMGAVRFQELSGERSFYLSSPSSQAEIREEVIYLDFCKLQGQSVAFTGAPEESAEEIIAAYGAEVVFIEEACGVKSYYCVSPRFSRGILLGGRFVNLHIAVEGERLAVGSPIIFGGF